MQSLTTQRKTNSQLQREFKLRQRARGLRPVSLWIDKSDEEWAREIAKKENRPKSELLAETVKIGINAVLEKGLL